MELPVLEDQRGSGPLSFDVTQVLGAKINRKISGLLVEPEGRRLPSRRSAVPFRSLRRECLPS